MTEQQEMVGIPYTKDEIQQIKDFSITKQKIEFMLDILESTKDVEMPMLALEAKIIEKIDSLVDII